MKDLEEVLRQLLREELEKQGKSHAPANDRTSWRQLIVKVEESLGNVEFELDGNESCEAALCVLREDIAALVDALENNCV